MTPEAFRAQLQFLGAAGYVGVTIRQLADWQHGIGTMPAKPIALTFDDAYESVAEHAVPPLERIRWPATIFAVTSQLGGTNAWDHHAPPARLLCVTDLRRLTASGHEVGSHSRTHARIRGLGTAQATTELSGSRAELEDAIGAPVRSFAFPYGSHDPGALTAVRDAGYAAACTLKRWANPQRGNSLRLGRMGVGGPLPIWQFALKLRKLLLTPAWA